MYPAIRRTAEFLVSFRDPPTKLPPGTACEDDNPPKPGQPTMHSSGPVILAMRSAVKAAEALGREEDAARYRARAQELEVAIDREYNVEGGAWTRDFGDGGWTLWPIELKPYDHPRMRAQGELAWQRVKPAFEAPDGPKKRGQYEVKALHGLPHLYNAVDPPKMDRVKRGLDGSPEIQVAWQDTGIMGESWYVRDGEVISVVSQPPVWEQVLVYLAAIEAYGRSAYEPSAAGTLAGEAPELRLTRRCVGDGRLRVRLEGEVDEVRDVNFKFDRRLMARDTEGAFEQTLDREALATTSAERLRAVAYLRDGSPFRVVLARSLPRCGLR